MGKKIWITEVDKEIKKNPLSTGVCKNCFSDYRLVVSRMYNRVGFCGRRCKRAFKKKNRKQSAAKQRSYKQKKRRENQKQVDFYKSNVWRELRFKVLRYYGFRCMACGADAKGSVLHVDHIKPRSRYPALELSFDNLQVLCADCNMGKSDFFDDDLRPADEEADFLTDAARFYKGDD